MYLRPLSLVLLAAAVACNDDDITGPDPADPFRDCASVVRINLGANLNGELATTDCQEAGGFFTDYYEFRLDTNRDISIDLASNQFNAFLELYERETGRLVIANNDGGVGVNARIAGFLPVGTYVVAASTLAPGETGAYGLAVTQTQ